MFEKLIDAFISASHEATHMYASYTSNILHVNLTVHNTPQVYDFICGSAHSVMLPVNSRSSVWSIVSALHEYQSAPAADLLIEVQRAIQQFEVTSKYTPLARVHALFFIATTGIIPTADDSLVQAYLTGVYPMQLALFKKALGQSKVANLEAWKSFSTRFADETVLRPLIYEINSRSKVPFSTRVQMYTHKNTLEWGIKSAVGDRLGRLRVVSVQTS